MSDLFLTINGTEISNHGREASISESLSVNDLETSGGRIKRYFRRTTKRIDLTFTYLPNKSDKTVDLRAGRDFIANLAYNNPLVLVTYQDRPSETFNEFYGYINEYQEKIIRRDLKTQCTYYDLNFTIEEK